MISITILVLEKSLVLVSQNSYFVATKIWKLYQNSFLCFSNCWLYYTYTDFFKIRQKFKNEILQLLSRCRKGVVGFDFFERLKFIDPSCPLPMRWMAKISPIHFSFLPKRNVAKVFLKSLDEHHQMFPGLFM